MLQTTKYTSGFMFHLSSNNCADKNVQSFSRIAWSHLLQSSSLEQDTRRYFLLVVPCWHAIVNMCQPVNHIEIHLRKRISYLAFQYLKSYSDNSKNYLKFNGYLNFTNNSLTTVVVESFSAALFSLISVWHGTFIRVIWLYLVSCRILIRHWHITFDSK